MKCPFCGHANPEDALFCMRCGTRLAVLCASCGQDLLVDAVFCGYCGASVTAREVGTPGATLMDSASSSPTLIPSVASTPNRAATPHLYLGDGSIANDTTTEMRKAHHLTKSQLGQLLGVSRRTIRAWEYGEWPPTRGARERLVAFMLATAAIMAEHHGIVPPHMSFRKHVLPLPDGSQPPRPDWLIEVDIEPVRQQVRDTLHQLDVLRAELSASLQERSV